MAVGQALRIGLTGGIGSGKSTVATLLARLGAAVVDTDLIARQLSGPDGPAIEAIKAAFGAVVIDAHNALDRSRMRAIVFAEPDAKRRLEAILHPMIARETERQATAAAARVIVFDVPLLVESGRWPALVDRVWVVDCRATTQLQRVTARSGWSEAAARAVIAQQATRARRRDYADAVVYNDGIGIDELRRQVRPLWDDCIGIGR
ncbi:MAG: dephospho-CoA kinase [Caldimonas sp.]